MAAPPLVGLFVAIRVGFRLAGGYTVSCLPSASVEGMRPDPASKQGVAMEGVDDQFCQYSLEDL